MASSKARSRNRSARSGGARPAARTTAKPQGQAQGQKPQAANAPAAKAPTASATPQAAGSQADQAPATAQGGPGPGRAKRQAAGARPAEPLAPASPAGPPPWLQWTSFGLAILGFGVSAYETYAELSKTPLAGCPTGGNGTFDCAAVLTSSQSMVFGVFPVAVLGLIFYAVVIAIMSPWAWRIQRREVGLLRLAAMVTGMGFVMYLIYAEVVQIQQICEYCTGVHIITFLLFCITVFSAAIWGLGKTAPQAKAKAA